MDNVIGFLLELKDEHYNLYKEDADLLFVDMTTFRDVFIFGDLSHRVKDNYINGNDFKFMGMQLIPVYTDDFEYVVYSKSIMDQVLSRVKLPIEYNYEAKLKYFEFIPHDKNAGDNIANVNVVGIEVKIYKDAINTYAKKGIK